MAHILHVLQVLIAESYGGRDEPVDTLTGSFVDINVEPVMDPLRIKETPSEATYQVLHLWSLRLMLPSHKCLWVC